VVERWSPPFYRDERCEQIRRTKLDGSTIRALCCFEMAGLITAAGCDPETLNTVRRSLLAARRAATCHHDR
jgi:hypothetical protein